MSTTIYEKTEVLSQPLRQQSPLVVINLDSNFGSNNSVKRRQTEAFWQLVGCKSEYNTCTRRGLKIEFNRKARRVVLKMYKHVDAGIAMWSANYILDFVLKKKLNPTSRPLSTLKA